MIGRLHTEERQAFLRDDIVYCLFYFGACISEHHGCFTAVLGELRRGRVVRARNVDLSHTPIVIYLVTGIDGRSSEYACLQATRISPLC